MLTLSHLTYEDGKLLDGGVDLSTKTTRGYRQLYVQGKGYLLHRLIFYYHNGYFPKVVDHIDGDITNNKIENLQGCDQRLNIAKSKMFKTNNTGFRGVHFNKLANKYEAYVWIDSKKHYCGLYNTAGDAYNARIEYLGRKYGQN
jgi:hypothetical protein